MTVINLKQRNNLQDRLEEDIIERIVLDIKDRPDHPLKKSLEQWPDLIDKSKYVKKNKQLYMLNDHLNLIFDIRNEELEEEIEIMNFYPTDIRYRHFYLNNLRFTTENIIGIAIKKPYQIFLDKELIC